MKIWFAVWLFAMSLAGADYSASRISVDSFEVVELRDSARDIVVRVAPSFGNNAYSMKVKGQDVFWCPSENLKELKARNPLCGNPFLAPWANRIEGDSFWANGRQYQFNSALGNIRRDGNKNPIHGLLYSSSLWQIVTAGADANAAWVTSRLEFARYPDLMAQFPFAHTLEMTYRLQDGKLQVETAMRSLAAEPMPVAIGFHPYFRVHDAPRDEWTVQVAARQRMVLSEKLIPTGEIREPGFTNPVSLKDTRLDDVFVGLERDSGQVADFWVKGRQQKVTVRYGPKYQVAVVFAPPGREFICFEPMAAITNAFNLAHQGKYTDLQLLPPGGEWRESYWIIPEGF